MYGKYLVVQLNNGKHYNEETKNGEAHKVMNQIHGYMDQHESRYGYKVEPDRKKGILNSIYVLFFLHWKLANDTSEESGWRLRSFGKEDPPSATSAASIAPLMRTAAVAKRVNLIRQGKADRGQTSGKILNTLRSKAPAVAT
jgi:hypothetical protein